MNARIRSAAADAPAASAREELVRHATAIFAAKGFAAASTREICEAAGVNVAAIRYYFGDKAGLYRETLLRPITDVIEAFGRFDDPALPLEDALRMFIAPIVGMDGAGPDAEFEAQVMKLHLREMLEPSAAFREVVEQTIAPAHRALCALLAHHCGLREADNDIHQLAFALVAMANDYCMSREFMRMLAPGVLDRPRAMETILDRLVGYARALVDHEIARRRQAAPRARAKQHERHTQALQSRDADASSTRKPTARKAGARRARR